MSFFDCKWKKLGMSAAILLSVYAGVSTAQNETPQKAFTDNSYAAPKGLPNFEVSKGVSSEDFERLIGLKKPEQQPPESARKMATGPQELTRTTAQPPPNLEFPTASENLRIPEWPVPIGIDGIKDDIRVLDGNWTPWWQVSCAKPMLTGDSNKVRHFDLEQLIWLSMEYSPRVKSILIAPKIQATDIDIAKGEFDRRRVAKTNYRDTSDPVGNTLTTGGPTRLNEQFWENSVGIRDRNTLGGKTELSQLIIARDNNSLFFKPNNQADTKLSLNYTQPLLRGSGRYYNTSSIRLAGLKTRESIAEANQGLQRHAWDVISVYWELVLQRYLMEQSKQGHDRLRQISLQLQNRRGLDLIQTHLDRANAAISNQKAQIHRFEKIILGLQESLRRLVNAPELEESSCNEIIPLTMPTTEKLIVPLQEELLSALEHRGDLIAVQERIEQAMVQNSLAVSELRHQLDFEMESYVKGLRGNNEVGEALVNQLDTGRPSFGAGVAYQRPVGNRSAKANSKSRELEIRKLCFDYSDSLKKAYADIKTSILNAEGTYEINLAAIESTLLTRNEVNGHKTHFEDFMRENTSSSNVLNDLLDSELRLISAENAWAKSQIEHMLALMKIKFESGLLMTVTVDPVN